MKELFELDVEVGEDTVVFDGEISRPIVDKKDWSTPHLFPISVICTLDDKNGYRDWIGDEGVPRLFHYLNGFSKIVGFNQIRFDYGLIDGALIREFERGDASRKRVAKALQYIYDIGKRDPEPGMVKRLFQGRSVDLLLDINSFLDDLSHPRRGRRANLDAIASAMFDHGKVSHRFNGGAEAPKAWGANLILEVIAYCRMDVSVTAKIYRSLLNGDNLLIKNWPAKGINDFGEGDFNPNGDRVIVRVR